MIYLVVSGLNSCPDMDDIKAYSTDKEKAEAFASEGQRTETGLGIIWDVIEVDEI